MSFNAIRENKTRENFHIYSTTINPFPTIPHNCRLLSHALTYFDSLYTQQKHIRVYVLLDLSGFIVCFHGKSVLECLSDGQVNRPREGDMEDAKTISLR